MAYEADGSISLRMILSADENWAIGRSGQLLYHIPPDMRRFRELTTGGVVIMGRKTWDSLPAKDGLVYGRDLSGGSTTYPGRALPDRLNIVLTREYGRSSGLLEEAATAATYHEPGTHTAVTVCDGLDSLWRVLRSIARSAAGIDTDRIWVIGGAQIYRLLMPYCSEAYVTRILIVAGDADCYMTNLDEAEGWELGESSIVYKWQDLQYRYDVYRQAEHGRAINCL